MGAVADFSPRKVFRRVQAGEDLFSHPELWLCTTCANCLRVCPKEVNMIDIMPAVREEAVLEGQAPAELQKALENSQRYGNPLGESPRKRADWVASAGVPVPILAQERRPVDVLWLVECYPSYHARCREATRAVARVFQRLGVDFAILGPEEKCTGDSQRLAGERGLFEMLAEDNIATLRRYRFNRIVVTDPHAYNALKNEYPKLGGEYEVLHYTQFLAPLIGRLDLRARGERRVTFHDPCYLGRHNGEYEAPRRLLEAIPGVRLVEMPHARGNSFCCGGGGGGMWLDGHNRELMSERLSDRRVKEAVATGADVMAVACPYDLMRFEDGVKATGNEGRMVVRDVIELIAEALADFPTGGMVS